MDFNSFEVIPHRVLIYFTYSNSLDSLEKAYLYSNVLENREACEEVFGAYYSKMIPFVEEQLLKGRMNEHLAYLYHYFQKEILEKPANTKAVCDILFYRKIVCENRNIIGDLRVTAGDGRGDLLSAVGRLLLRGDPDEAGEDLFCEQQRAEVCDGDRLPGRTVSVAGTVSEGVDLEKLWPIKRSSYL